MTEKFTIEAIAHIHTEFKSKFGIPRQSGRVEELYGEIIFCPKYRNPDALREIESFSHLWLIFDFSEAHRENWSPMVRPPRLGGNRKVGVFASRSPFRPNFMGLSCVKLVSINKSEKYGMTLTVSGADLLDGTPIYDIKPYLPFADAHPEASGGYADREVSHRLSVDFPKELLEKLPERLRTLAVNCISEDPRPSYRDDALREYTITLGGFDIDFNVDENRATVYAVREIL